MIVLVAGQTVAIWTLLALVAGAGSWAPLRKWRERAKLRQRLADLKFKERLFDECR